MEEYKQKYKRLIRRKKLFTIGFFAIIGLSFISGLTGIIVVSVKNHFELLTLFVLLAIAVPAALWLIYLICLLAVKEKKRGALDLELESSNISADDIMQLGQELKIDLFGVALSKRCKELGIEGAPEWCVRDGVLPTAEDVSR